MINKPLSQLGSAHGSTPPNNLNEQYHRTAKMMVASMTLIKRRVPQHGIDTTLKGSTNT